MTAASSFRLQDDGGQRGNPLVERLDGLDEAAHLLLQLRIDRDALLQRGEVCAQLLDDLAATECLLPADQLLDLREVAFPGGQLAGGGTDRAGEEVDALDEVTDLLVDPLLELLGIDGRRRGRARSILGHDAQLVLHGCEPGLDALVALRERLGENREPALLRRETARGRPDDAGERLDPLGQRRDRLVQRMGRSSRDWSPRCRRSRPRTCALRRAPFAVR